MQEGRGADVRKQEGVSCVGMGKSLETRDVART